MGFFDRFFPKKQERVIKHQKVKAPIQKAKKDTSSSTRGVSSESVIGEIEVDEDIHPSTGLKSLRDKEITSEDMEWLIKRTGFGYSQIDRMLKDPWRNGFELRSQSEGLADMAFQLLKDIDFSKHVARAYVYSKVVGCGLLYLDLPIVKDKSEPVENLKPPKKTSIEGEEDYDYSETIKKIVALKGTQVEEFIYDKEGEIEAFKIYKIGLTGQSETIHKDRIIHIANWLLSNNPLGTSFFLPQYDGLTDLSNANMALIESFIKASTGIVCLELPSYHAPTPGQTDDAVTPEDYAWAEEKFKDIDVMKHFIHPRDWVVSAVDMNKGVNPDPYMQSIVAQLAAGSRIAKVILSGAETGQLTGSEYIVKQYRELVSDWRKEIEDIMLDLLHRFQLWKVLPDGYIEVSWNPIDAPTSMEEADLSDRKASGFLKFAMALEKYDTLGWKPYIRDQTLYLIKATRDKKVMGMEAPMDYPVTLIEEFKESEILEKVSAVFPSPFAPDIPKAPLSLPGAVPLPLPLQTGLNEENPEAPRAEPPTEEEEEEEVEEDSVLFMDKYKITKEEKDRLLKVWNMEPIMMPLTYEYGAEMTGTLWTFINEWLQGFKTIAERVGFKETPPAPAKPNNKDKKRRTSKKKDQYEDPEMIKKMVQQAIKLQIGGQNIEDLLEQGIGEGMEEGWENYNKVSGIKSPFKVGMPWVAEYMATHVPTLTEGIKTEVTAQMVQAMQQGLQKGMNYQDVYKLVKQAGGKYTQDNVGKVIHKVMHEAVNASRIEAAKEAGQASEEKMMVYITQGDERVRPEHQLREGNLYPPDEMQVLLSEWNCRCSCVPALAIERLRGGLSLSKGELGFEEPTWENPEE